MTSLTINARFEVLQRIEAAQTELNAATAAASSLRGWSDQWSEIDAHAEATKALWYRIMEAPMPLGHDSEPPTP